MLREVPLGDWLTSKEMAQQVGVNYWFLRDWIRADRKTPYPEGLRPLIGQHYIIKRGKRGYGGRCLLWNPAWVTKKLIKRLERYKGMRMMRGIGRNRESKVIGKRVMGKDTPTPQGVKQGEIYCPWRGRFVTKEFCYRCWITKPESDRPDGYQWEEHCQRGISVEEWKSV